MDLREFVTKDTGNGHTQFGTGSRRDTRSGKGRFDLVPWDAVLAASEQMACIVESDQHAYGVDRRRFWAGEAAEYLVGWLAGTYDYHFIARALACVMIAEYGFGPGPNLGNLPWEALRRWAGLMERGADKYGERNWELGQPLVRFFDSAMRHLYQWLEEKDTEEDHFSAVLYNLGAIYYTHKRVFRGLLPYELDDRPRLVQNLE